MSQSIIEASSKIIIVIDRARAASLDFFSCLSGWQWELMKGKILRAGFTLDRVDIFTLDQCREFVAHLPSSVILGLGESTLNHFTGKSSVDKWALSPLVLEGGRTFIPCYGFDRIQKQYELGLYLDFALRRAFEFLSEPIPQTAERFLLNPGLEETLATLRRIKDEPEISVDIETGYGQINTVGFAWTESDAIAINVLPDRCADHSYFELWRGIQDVLESPSRKILQNFIYDVSYFSAYGIDVANIAHDTMWAMKVLWPELKSNLGNVGRIYTKRPYWKDDGKVTDEEGKKKNWGDIRDWTRHYLYNCRDTTGTLEAAHAQRKDLADRKMSDFFDGYLLRLIEPIREMCTEGFPVCGSAREGLKADVGRRLDEATKAFQEKVGREINPLSSKQVLAWLNETGVKLPKKFDKEKGGYRESADASSIKKIRLKQDLPGLAELQEIKTLRKALSSYINFDLRPDGRLSYSLNGAGAETLRWTGGKDAWDRGFNIQTIPREGSDVSIKSMFVAPEGHAILEADLKQAESRFVAYDSADKTLIDMLENGDDVHSHVGYAILRQMGKDPASVPKDEFKKTWRQLGKKAGHGLNYGMKAGVFVETVFNELDLVITKRDAELITEAYFGLFPGIPRWHAWIKRELYNKRKLTTPFGWERYFYGRPGDEMNKEGLAFRPQSTIPYITNLLLLHLWELRRRETMKFRFLVQVHDALYLLCPDEEIPAVARVCLDHKSWQPGFDLPGGKLLIPTEVKTAKRLSEGVEYVG